MAAAVQIDGDTMRIHFREFGIESYRLFLKAKALPEYQVAFHKSDETYEITAPARFAAMLGVQAEELDRGDLPFADFLFDDQLAITRIALQSKRFACWSGCGFGKTLIGLEFARHVAHRTGRRVLIVTLNEIVNQWIEEAARFYDGELPVYRIRSRAEMKRWAAGQIEGPAIAITNYEKMNPDAEGQVVNELRRLGGVVIDEAHRLRTGGGKQKWALIKSCKGIEYKLLLTATPAPNDTMEFASQASFLEKMRDEGEILWTYFKRDPKTHRWAVNPYAREAFFRFMSSWSIYVNDPRKYGWRKGHQDIPPPITIERKVAPTEEQIALIQKFSREPNGQLSLVQQRDVNAIERMKLSQLAKGFYYATEGKKRRTVRVPSRKPGIIGDIVAEESAGGAQVLVWTIFDAESDILAEELRTRGVSFDLLAGKTPEKQRLKILDEFRHGRTRVLVSRANMLGHGMNFQFCRAMVFSGWSDSFVLWYQAIRRAYRYGQTERVRVYVPVIEELEMDMLDNILSKESRHFAEIDLMERNYIEAMRETGQIA